MPGVAVGDFAGASGVMVDWEDEREKVLARGARWVSLSSEQDGQFYARCSSACFTLGGSNDGTLRHLLFVSFQDMVMEFPDH